jgi:hypothetical protein
MLSSVVKVASLTRCGKRGADELTKESNEMCSAPDELSSPLESREREKGRERP